MLPIRMPKFEMPKAAVRTELPAEALMRLQSSDARDVRVFNATGEAVPFALMEPVRNRVWFAGEAAHESQWGTVGGAWESGERAADQVLKVLGAR